MHAHVVLRLHRLLPEIEQQAAGNHKVSSGMALPGVLTCAHAQANKRSASNDLLSRPLMHGHQRRACTIVQRLHTLLPQKAAGG